MPHQLVCDLEKSELHVSPSLQNTDIVSAE